MKGKKKAKRKRKPTAENDQILFEAKEMHTEARRGLRRLRTIREKLVATLQEVVYMEEHYEEIHRRASLIERERRWPEEGE